MQVGFQRRMQHRSQPVIAEQHVVAQVAGKGAVCLAGRVVPSQHREHVNVRPRLGIAPRLGAEEHHPREPCAMVRLEPLPKLRQEREDGRHFIHCVFR